MLASQLVLSPEEPLFFPENRQIWIQKMQQRGFLGHQCFPERYEVGERFLDWVTFLGCSPSLNFEPQDDLAFCHLFIPEVFKQPVVLSHPHLPASSCLSCGEKVHWKHQPDYLPEADSILNCPACGNEAGADQFRWRKRQFCSSRAPILIWEVGEGEAVPSDQLLELLRNESGGEWRYSYASHSAAAFK